MAKTQMPEEGKKMSILGQEVRNKLGSGWRYNVWENLGWHVEWIKGAVSLHYNKQTKRFWAMVGPVDSGAGHMDLTPQVSTCSSPDPIEAVRIAIKFAFEVVEKEWEPIMTSMRNVILNLS